MSNKPSARLMVHAGGWEATPEEVFAIKAPPATATYAPVSPSDFFSLIHKAANYAGLEPDEDSVRWALARPHPETGVPQQYFATMLLDRYQNDEYGYALGWRGSIDKSLANLLAAGSNVFNCNNLTLSGQFQAMHKNTPGVWAELPSRLIKLFGRIVEEGYFENMDEIIGQMKRALLTEDQASGLMIEAVRRKIYPASKLPKVIELWDGPRNGEDIPADHAAYAGRKDAWSLVNTFTNINRERSAQAQWEGGMHIFNLVGNAVGAFTEGPSQVELDFAPVGD